MISGSTCGKPASGSLSYLGAMSERPHIDVNDFTRNRLVLEPHAVEIADARPVLGVLSLAREGFILVRQKLPAVDYRSADSLLRDYAPAITALIQYITGADRVIGTDEPIVRMASPEERDAVRPAPFVHADFTIRGARDLLRRSWDRRLPRGEGQEETARIAADLLDHAPAERGLYRRAMIIQTWRVVTPPPHDVPLAICAADSVHAAEVVEGDYVIRFSDNEELRSETAFFRYSDRHRWFHVSDIEPDEVLLFMGFDFDRPEAARVPHTGFRAVASPPGAVGRISIETRGFALFH